MGFGFWELMVILVIVFVLFGAGKLPRVMGDIGKGIKSLKDGLKEGETGTAKIEKTESDSPKN
jgi:sec-independent protein translocase protein TatA